MLSGRCTRAARHAPRRTRSLAVLAVALIAQTGCFADRAGLGDEALESSAARVDGTEPTVLYDFRALQGDGLNRLEPRADGGYMATTRRGGAHDRGAVVRIDADGAVHVVYSFDGTVGAVPRGGLTRVGDRYFGTTSEGGEFGFGTAFSIAVDGSLHFLHSFKHEEGGSPRAGLVHAANGDFYGTTGGVYTSSRGGPPESGGRIFRMRADGWVTVLHAFGNVIPSSDPTRPPTLDAGEPVADLVDGGDGYLYGTTAVPEIWESQTFTIPTWGTVFRISLEGRYELLHAFAGAYKDGGHPVASLVKGPDGSLYGTTSEETEFKLRTAYGTVFRIAPTGGLTTLHTFAPQQERTDGREPDGPLVVSADGKSLLGTTSSGGAEGLGTVFRIGLDGTFSTLASISKEAGRAPWRLQRDHSGALLVIGQSTIATLSESAPAPRPSVQLGYREGAGPTALVQGRDESLYGVTERGGANGYGTIFRLDAQGRLTVLHHFGTPGAHGPLTAGPDGALYGTIGSGGPYSAGQGALPGSVYRVARDGTFTVLHAFQGPDGKVPSGPLTLAPDGTLYGTTRGGGAFDRGTAFRLAPDGAFALLHSFGATPQAPQQPNGGLALGDDGNLYGTTPLGGNRPDDGVVFRMTPSGEITTPVIFDQRVTSGPRAGLVRGDDGFFYGTTVHYEEPMIFRVSQAGALELLHVFDGPAPDAELLWGRDGRVYGTRQTYDGSSTLFGLDPRTPGSFVEVSLGVTVLDSASPPTLGSDDALYVALRVEGAGGGGSILRYAPQQP